MRAVLPYLQHILDAIGFIQTYTTAGRDAFHNDRKTQDAVIRNLEIIGEAVRNVPPDFQSAHAGIPWRQAAELRNVLIHEYFGVDLNVVWAVVEKELPPLKASIEQVVAKVNGGRHSA